MLARLAINTFKNVDSYPQSPFSCLQKTTRICMILINLEKNTFGNLFFPNLSTKKFKKSFFAPGIELKTNCSQRRITCQIGRADTSTQTMRPRKMQAEERKEMTTLRPTVSRHFFCFSFPYALSVFLAQKASF